MTTSELRTAFINRLPVLYHVDGQPEREYDYIYRIIYSHIIDSDEIAVDAVVVDKDGDKHRLSASALLISGELSNTPCNLPEIPFVHAMYDLFRRRAPIHVSDNPIRDYPEICELHFDLIGGEVVLFAMVWNGLYERRVAPQDIEEDTVEHFFYYYDALNCRDLEESRRNKLYDNFVEDKTTEAHGKVHDFAAELRKRTKGAAV